MSHHGSLYLTLGIDSSASPSEIRQAYRAAAKRAHPDAGGSGAAMAKVNEAYQILGDPEARRAYDQAEAAPLTDHHHEAAARAEAEAVNRGRIVWARRSAWELLRTTAPWAIGAIIVTRLAAGQIDPHALMILSFVGFLPVYGLILSIIFLNDPPLRLVFADLAHRYPTDKSERAAAAAIVLAYFPLALLWSLWH